MASTTPNTTPSYASVLTALSPPKTPTPLIAPPSPYPTHPTLSATIAALELHPTLETLLHILNGDLSSAHFLVRHMESPPAFEGMLLHALVHRVEGDIENARCWYFDVFQGGREVWDAVWGKHLGVEGGAGKDENAKMSEYADGKKEYDSKPEEARAKLPPFLTEFLDRVARLRKHVLKSSANPLPAGVTREVEEAELREISVGEIGRLREFCEGKFGTGRWDDARSEFVGVGEQRGEISEKKGAMLVGGEGFRHF